MNFKDLVESFVEVSEEIELFERKFFKTRKSVIDRNKKKNTTQRKRDKLSRKVYYRRNKARIKKNQKIYRKRAKARPSMVRTHRK